jgi:hypothetical protein
LKILLLNQAFYPDVVSSSQHARDLAVGLAEAGHHVTVVASRRAYDSPGRKFKPDEIWNGIRVIRIPSLGLWKRSKWRRSLDFGSFVASCLFALARLGKFDVVIGMTSPPLIAFIAALFTRLKGGKLVYWVLDLNPDEAIAAGWLHSGSLAARMLNRMSQFTLRASGKIVVLDRFMKERVLAKGIDPKAVDVIPPWSHDDAVHDDMTGREAFRREHGLTGKFVVMYSGNHSPCHPLDSLVAAARRLASNPEIVFCFVGGGSEHARVRRIAGEEGLRNIICLPYQPIERLSASLKSADIHAVVMGDPFVGIVHPCKIYNVLRLGMPVLYIGPEQGHVPDMVPAESRETSWFYAASHGQVDLILDHISTAMSNGPGTGTEQRRIAARFSEKVLLNRMIDAIESVTVESAAKTEPLVAESARH